MSVVADSDPESNARKAISPPALLDALESLLNSKPLGVVAYNAESQVVHASDGMEKLCNLTSAGSADALVAEAHAGVAQNRSAHQEIQMPAKDGSVMNMEVWSTPVALQNGGTGRLLLADDVTEQRFLERALLEAADRERQRIGQDLHDHLCQHLLGAAFAVKALAGDLDREKSRHAAELHDIARLINEAVSQVREVSRGLHPVELDAAGLITALHELASRTNSSLPCEFHSEPPVLLDDVEQSLQAYRIAQEAVAAAFHQTGASRVQMRLSEQADWITLEVSDDGKTEGEISANPHGTASRTLQYRALAMNGRLSLSFDPQEGTRVKCVFPRRQ